MSVTSPPSATLNAQFVAAMAILACSGRLHFAPFSTENSAFHAPAANTSHLDGKNDREESAPESENDCLCNPAQPTVKPSF